MYVIHGENDELFPLEETQGYVEATIDAGSDINLCSCSWAGPLYAM